MRRTSLLIVAGALALAAPVAACGGDDTASSTTTQPSGGGGRSSLTIHALDTLTFDKSSYEAKPGEVDVSYVNDGSVDHTLLVKGVSGFKLSVGREDDGTLDLEPGTYTLYCDVAGHQAAGMEAELTVK